MTRRKSQRIPAIQRDTKARAMNRAAMDPITTNSLKKIPPELRQMIFKFSGVNEDVLAGFIGNQEIYQDALKIYWETKRITFPLNVNDDRKKPWVSADQCHLSQKTLNSIRKVRVVVDPFFWVLPSIPELVQLNVTDLRLQFCNPMYSDTNGSPSFKAMRDPWWYMAAVRDVLAAFSSAGRGLRTISCEFEAFQVEAEASDMSLLAMFRGKRRSGGIDLLNHAFGIKAKMRYVGHGSGPTVYFWENPDGSDLRWCWYRSTKAPPEFTDSGMLNSLSKDLCLEKSAYFRRQQGDSH